MVKKWELVALSALIVGVPASIMFSAIVGDLFLPKAENVRTIVIRARVSELGSFDQTEVIVNQGERIKLMIYAEDVLHGFGLSGYNINVELHPGKWTEVEFTAERPGEFPFFCTIYCSPLHGLMRGKLKVVPTS